MIVTENGIKEYRNEKDDLHREDGPAVIYQDSTEKWYLNGQLHREDGPAVVGGSVNGETHWYLNGKPHRDGSPAIMCYDGHTEWWLHGKLHNEDGPAIIFPSGNKEWYINGQRLTETEFNTKCNYKKYETFYNDHRIHILQYENLRRHFKQLTETVLGKDYYNMGHDVYQCDKYTCEDLKKKLNKGFFKNIFK